MQIAARIGAWSGKALPFDAVEYIRRPIGGATVRWTLPFRPEDNDVISWTASIEDAASSWVSAGFTSYEGEYVESTRVIKAGFFIIIGILLTASCFFLSMIFA